jgi:hypothetical protein
MQNTTLDETPGQNIIPMTEQQMRRYNELVELFRSRGGRLRSRYYESEEQTLSGDCEVGHYWRTTPARLSRGNWCTKCSADERRISQEKVAAKVAEKGGRMIGTYVNSKTPFAVQCPCTYVWDTTWDRLLRGSWCPKCAGQLPPTTEEVRQLVASKGGTLLSAYVSSQKKLDVLCQYQHLFHPTSVMGTNGWRVDGPFGPIQPSEKI